MMDISSTLPPPSPSHSAELWEARLFHHPRHLRRAPKCFTKFHWRGERRCIPLSPMKIAARGFWSWGTLGIGLAFGGLLAQTPGCAHEGDPDLIGPEDDPRATPDKGTPDG